MGQVIASMIRMKIEQVQRGEITPIAAADTIADWCAEDIQDERDYAEECEEAIESRELALIRASFTTGVPDLFSDEMREYWNAGRR